jgi:eukaryotic-like serine/threonine-protein kinase
MPTNPFDQRAVQAVLGGRYEILHEIRVGGQGAVFYAKRKLTPANAPASDLVALKLHLDPKQDIRVEREIKAMEGVVHPCLSRLIEHGFCDIAGKRTRYIAWEFIEGEALDGALASGPLHENKVTQMARDVCLAIAAIWKKRIVHRDINPKNIMLRAGGGAVLIDLGGARHLDETSVTAYGMTFGTQGYFSPEQYRTERALTNASDVFSLGIVITQSLIGRHPTSFDQHQLAIAPPRCTSLAPQADRSLCHIVDRMLSVRAAFRPAIDELVQFFSAFKRTH